MTFANAFAERWVRSVKEECLSRLIFFGENSLRRALTRYIEHYHRERNHQGKANQVSIARNDHVSHVCSHSQPRTRFIGAAKLPFIPPASSMSIRAVSIVAPSVRPDGEGRDPGLSIRPVVRAQCVRIEAARDAAVVAEQLEHERQRNRG